MELWKLHIHAYLKNQGKQKIIWKWKKICEYKIFEKWSRIKTIWKKTGVLKFIWKLKSRKLNLKFGILKKLFENGNSENSIWKLEF